MVSRKLGLRRKLALLAVAIPIAFGQAPAVPQWQIAAGGKMAFDVASVKPSKPGTFTPPNFPLDAGDAYVSMTSDDAPRGRFSADFPLTTYIEFAYKLQLTQEQTESMIAHLPKWVSSDRYSIQAKVEGNPTKDQMRLMTQSLLAERFQLAVHFETQRAPVFALTLVKPGKLGPNLRPHAEGVPCDDPKSGDAFPPRCDVYMMTLKKGVGKVGSRNTTMELLAGGLPSLGRLGRPVVDQTGLSGRFDFSLEWTPEPNGPPRPDAPPPADTPGLTFLEALHDQLGLKLVSTNAPIQILIVDHVARPSEN